MLDWTLFNLPDPDFMANIGEPPEPIIPSAHRDSRPHWDGSHEYQDGEKNSEDDSHYNYDYYYFYNYDDIRGMEDQPVYQPANNADGTVDDGIWATVNDRVWFENNGQAVNNPNRPKVTDGNRTTEAANDGKWPENQVTNGNWQENHAEHHYSDGNWANHNTRALSYSRNRPGSNSVGVLYDGNWPKHAVNVANWPKNPLNDWKENNAVMPLNDENLAENDTDNDAMETESAATAREDGLPENHALPAAYMMWKDLAVYMNERASQWKDAEFQFRKQRAAILYEIQIQNMQKGLLETALEEIHRQEELQELDRLIRRHARQGFL